MDRNFEVNGVEAILPLSLAQTGMWIKERLSPADLSFVLAEAIEINGPIDIHHFCAALRQLTREVESIRSQICEIDGRPQQIVYSEYRADFEILDLSQQDDPAAVADAWMLDELRNPLDLVNDPLWLSALLKLSETRWVWYHRSHHILFDGYAGGMLARRVDDIYSAMIDGRDIPACEFGPLQALLDADADYRASTHFRKDKAFWSERLAGLPAPVSLTARKTTPSGGLLRHSAFLDRTRVKALHTMARSMGASLPQMLIALVAAYYARATDREDLAIVTMVTARISALTRRVPGMMANAVPLRLNVTADATWDNLVHQVTQQMQRALRYQRYRYEDMRRDLGMVHQDEQIAWLGVNIEPFDYDLRFGGQPSIARNLSNGTMTDFTIFAYERGDGRDIRFDFDANPALYDLAELVDHEARFMRMIDMLIAAPTQPLGQMSLLSEEERQTVLAGWNDTSCVLPDLTWPALFRQQVLRTPEAVAVTFEGQVLTYRELDEASDRWAGLMAGQGIGKGDLVAVVVPRSERMLIALLAISKTGAAYVPLDPADPYDRIAMILDDAAPRAAITTQDYAPKLPDERVLARIFIDGAEPTDDYALPAGPDGDDTAYVIFTSGSTGRPKGVEVPHGALSNFLHAMNDLIAPTAADTLLAVTTISFDIAGLELYLPLMTGAKVVIVGRDVARDPMVLRRQILSSGITIMQATPSHWRALLADGVSDLVGLRPLVGGEALPVDLAQRMAMLGHPVLNLYGPTETTVWSTAMPLAGDDLLQAPIGHPIFNTQVYVLDSKQQPVPPSFVGELYIGGAGVAKGYYRRPDLTADRFLPNPFRTGERMYRTGDLARWRSDGVLDYLGRNDHQIKIRGFRVEPGEIEFALVAEPEIRQAVVILRNDPGQGNSLVAYLVAEPGETIDITELPARMAKRLPGHMVPAAFVTLDKIPLNVNGKTDRHALPAPQLQSQQGMVLPRTETEQQLADLWCELLGLEQVGIHDSFFDLGGDSLGAAGMLSGIRNSFESDLPLGAVFDTPTIAGLAAHLDRPADTRPLIAPVLKVRDSGKCPILFCVHPVLGVGWGFYSLANHLGDRFSLYALQSDALQDLTNLPQSIEEVASRYLDRIREIQPNGPYHLVGWSLGGLIAHEIARRLKAQGQEIAHLSMLDSYPFHPASGDTPRDEATLARAALGFLGFAENVIGDDPKLARLGDFLQERIDVDRNLFLHEVVKQDPEFIDRARVSILHYLDLAQRFEPGYVDIDVHFFSAQQNQGEAVQSLLNYQPEAWLPHVGGRIFRRALDCAHEDMLRPGPAAEIGAVIQAETLRELLVLGRTA